MTGRNRGGKIRILSKNISPTATSAHGPGGGAAPRCGQERRPQRNLNPEAAARAIARSKGVLDSACSISFCYLR